MQKRPKWVWAISIYYFISLLLGALSSYLIFSKKTSLLPQQAEFYSSFGSIHWAISIIGIIISFAAAITLFMLKKITVKIWLISLILGILSQIHVILTTPWLSMVGTPGIIGSIIGFSITIAIYLYTTRLYKRDLLN